MLMHSLETRTYRFACDEEVKSHRMGVNCETQEPQDFGPTLLVPLRDNEALSDAVESEGGASKLQHNAQDESARSASKNEEIISL